MVSAGFSQPEAAGKGGGSEGHGEFEPGHFLLVSEAEAAALTPDGVRSGPGDPDGAGFAGLCQNQDVSPVRGSEEETRHRSGARQQSTCHVFR